MSARSQPVEKLTWPDGCAVAPRCCACPLPMCIDDIGPDIRDRRLYARVILMDRSGKSAEVIAETTGADIRTVYNVLRKVRG